ncbi:MAG: SDR family NAD(P)-dependent oxidoreductase [Thaumarchaeota archaeon]|nr:SDR family NAD(P)-dependent oxidoreductase [Nitrososphaerota archaeon]
MKLEEARVVLTGVSRGVGLELLRLLLYNGSRVVACARNKGELTDADTSRFQFHMLDVSDPPQAKRLINSATKNFGGLDVLINNASVTHGLKLTFWIVTRTTYFPYSTRSGIPFL